MGSPKKSATGYVRWEALVCRDEQERLAVAVVSVTSSPNVPLLPLHNKRLSLVRSGELIALGWVQYIDCEDEILLASDVFCVGVTKHPKIPFAVANPGSWRRHRGGEWIFQLTAPGS